MKLRRIETWTEQGTERAWKACVDLDRTTLIVGRNATGKSKVLVSIRSLAQLITNRQRFADAHFRVSFDDSGASVMYELDVEEGSVRHERLSVDNEDLLVRRADGQGVIRAADANVSTLEFQIPVQALAAVVKRDSRQHPFLESLHKWAESLRFYRFNDFQKTAFGVFLQGAGGPPDPSDYQQSIGLFAEGKRRFGDRFEEMIVEDMSRIGYPISWVGLEEVEEVRLDPMIGGKPVALSVQETDLKCRTSQFRMSDGMFRALALVVHAAHDDLSRSASCMVVDDVGEGLDYERSAALIKLLMERVERGAIQIVMSTNDRFTMNAVPLDVWCGLRRAPTGVETVTKRSHPELFAQFALTGLNNFDFFRMDYFEAFSGNG
jgi:hypothetical protein